MGLLKPVLQKLHTNSNFSICSGLFSSYHFRFLFKYILGLVFLYIQSFMGCCFSSLVVHLNLFPSLLSFTKSCPVHCLFAANFPIPLLYVCCNGLIGLMSFRDFRPLYYVTAYSGSLNHRLPF